MTVAPELTDTPRRVLLVEDDAGDALLVSDLLADRDSRIELGVGARRRPSSRSAAPSW